MKKFIALLLTVVLFAGCGNTDSETEETLEVTTKITEVTEITEKESVDAYKITAEQYNKIEQGMTYEEVINIIGGSGEFIFETEIEGRSRSIYAWKAIGYMYASVAVSFEDDKVISKSQNGLKGTIEGYNEKSNELLDSEIQEFDKLIKEEQNKLDEILKKYDEDVENLTIDDLKNASAYRDKIKELINKVQKIIDEKTKETLKSFNNSTYK